MRYFGATVGPVWPACFNLWFNYFSLSILLLLRRNSLWWNVHVELDEFWQSVFSCKLVELFQLLSTNSKLWFFLFRDLVRSCFPQQQPASVQCYELFCMHMGIVTNQFVVNSCRKLAGLLYGASGEANSPISLLWM